MTETESESSSDDSSSDSSSSSSPEEVPETAASFNRKCSRLGMCEVCAAKGAHYACPKCEVKTCSLPCVRIHKKELQCDGQRDRTKFVPLNKMTSREFMSDYCFLEEATRYAEARKRFSLESSNKNNNNNNKSLSVPKHRLRNAAKQRKIRLLLQQPSFSKSKENTTYLDWKLRRIYWRVEWLFVNIPLEDNNKDNKDDNDDEDDEDEDQVQPMARFTDDRCDENESLAHLVLKYVDLQQESALNVRKRLNHHQTAGIGQLSFWLRAEGVPRSASCCYALEAATPLGFNLAGKTIIEFPTIYVTYEPKPPLGLEAIECDELEEEATTSPPAAKKAKTDSQQQEEKALASRKRNKIPKRSSHKRLRKAAYRRNIQLQEQEPKLSRHQDNTTCLDSKMGRLFWCVEWLFVNIPLEEEGIEPLAEPMARFVDIRCDELDTLTSLVRKYMDLKQEMAQKHQTRLANHQKAGIGQLKFWLRADGIGRSTTGCYALEANESLCKNLSGKIILEYPTFLITYNGKPPLGFEVIESVYKMELEENTSSSEEEEAEEEEEEDESDIFHGIATAFDSDDEDESEDDGVPENKPEEAENDDDDLASEESYTEQDN